MTQRPSAQPGRRGHLAAARRPTAATTAASKVRSQADTRDERGAFVFFTLWGQVVVFILGEKG